MTLSPEEAFAQPSSARVSNDPESENAAYSYDGKPDRWKRYRLPDPETGAAQGWTRATTFAKSISDTFSLSQWGVRMALKGMAEDDGLYAAVASTPLSDKEGLNKLGEQCKAVAGAKVGANVGTALHAFSEAVDRGEKPLIPPKWRGHIAAWTELLQRYNMEVVEIEKRVVHTGFGVAGTLDRLVRFTKDTTVTMKQGKKYVEHTFKKGAICCLDLKGLALDTPLPTPTGWTTMEKVQPGDQVLGADGKPCTVTAKSDVKRIGTYTVTFDDGAQIVCDSEHLWETTAKLSSYSEETAVRGIEEIAATLRNKAGAPMHRVKMPEPLELPEADLPIDPYVLGCWLGDGAMRGGSITKQHDLFKILEADEVPLGVEQVDKRSGAITRSLLGLTAHLRDAGLLHDKHIPEAYLRASFAQRLRLLQGLMDTDGSWNKPRRTAVFSSCNQQFAEQVTELIRTMGERPYMTYYKRKGFGLEVDSWTVEFTPRGYNPFRLPRKADQAAASTKNLSMASRRLIISVEPGPDVETQCIAIDSPDHLYLCGKEMIPTHNTGKDLSYGWMEIAVQLVIYVDAPWIFHQPGGPGTPWEYTPMYDEIDRDIALVIHIPAQAETAQATLYAVDLAFGRETAKLCELVRDARKRKNVAVALDVVEETITVASERVETPALEARKPTLLERAAHAITEAELTSLWWEAVTARQADNALSTAIQNRREELLADTAAG